MWVTRSELYHYKDPSQLREMGYVQTGSGKPPVGSKVVYGFTGTVKKGGPGRRTKYWIGRFHKPLGHTMAGTIGKEFNPHSGVRAQVRRLPSGQVQIKISLKRNEDPLRKAKQIAKALGRRITKISKRRV